jgi:hypothetical protein
MDWLNKLKEKLNPPPIKGQPLWETAVEKKVNRELVFFKDTFRVGILCLYSTPADHDAILKYKKDLDNLGYEAEVLMFVNMKEMPRDIYLPSFNLKDLNKQNIPYNPRTDRFVKKKFDMLFNLYFTDNEQLKYLATNSVAKCRYGAYREYLKEVTDVFVYTEAEDNIPNLIQKINEVLEKQKYVHNKI